MRATQGLLYYYAPPPNQSEIISRIVDGLVAPITNPEKTCDLLRVVSEIVANANELLPPLTKALQSDDGRLRTLASWALCTIGYCHPNAVQDTEVISAATEVLVSTLKSANEYSLFTSVLLNNGSIPPPPAAIGPLLGLSDNDDFRLRIWATAALSNVVVSKSQTYSDFHNSLRQKCNVVLHQGLNSNDPRLVLISAIALTRLGVSERGSLILNSLLQEGDEKFKYDLLVLLQQIGVAASGLVKSVESILEDEKYSGPLRAHAAEALGAITEGINEESVSILFRAAFVNTNIQVGKGAIRGIRHFRTLPESIKRVLTQGLTSSDINIRQRAFEQVGELGTHAEVFIPLLIAQLGRDTRVETSGYLAYALAAAGNVVVAPLIDIIKEHSPLKLPEVTAALALLRGTASSELVDVLALETDETTKSRILSILSEIEPPTARSMSRLVSMLDQEQNDDMAVLLIKVIYQMGPERVQAMRTLIDCACNRSSDTALWAKRTLLDLGDVAIATIQNDLTNATLEMKRRLETLLEELQTTENLRPQQSLDVHGGELNELLGRMYKIFFLDRVAPQLQVISSGRRWTKPDEMDINNSSRLLTSQEPARNVDFNIIELKERVQGLVTDSFEQFCKNLKREFEVLPNDFDTQRTKLRERAIAFRGVIAEVLEPLLNERAASMPQDTYEQKKIVSKWINTELHELGLAIRCPKTGQPAHCLANPGGTPGVGRFHLETVDTKGKRHRTVTAVKLPTLSLMPEDFTRAPYGSRSEHLR